MRKLDTYIATLSPAEICALVLYWAASLMGMTCGYNLRFKALISRAEIHGPSWLFDRLVLLLQLYSSLRVRGEMSVHAKSWYDDDCYEDLTLKKLSETTVGACCLSRIYHHNCGGVCRSSLWSTHHLFSRSTNFLIRLPEYSNARLRLCPGITQNWRLVSTMAVRLKETSL